MECKNFFFPWKLMELLINIIGYAKRALFLIFFFIVLQFVILFWTKGKLL